MSTKIYNGFRIKEGIALPNLLQSVREVLDPVRDHEDIQLLANTIASYIDDRWINGQDILPESAQTAYQMWAGQQAAMSSMDWDHDPNRFQLSTGTEPENGRIMAIIHVENKDLRTAFENMEEVEEFGYWNNTDSYPDGVTRADWKIREAAWNRMLPGAGQISATMDTWELRDSVEIREELREIRGVLNLMSSPTERATNTGMDAYADYLFREQQIDPMKAVNHVVFRRGQSVLPVIEAVAQHLPPLTVELLTNGSNGAVIDPGYRAAVKAACAELYEQDRAGLARKD